MFQSRDTNLMDLWLEAVTGLKQEKTRYLVVEAGDTSVSGGLRQGISQYLVAGGRGNLSIWWPEILISSCLVARIPCVLRT